jgi:hypothetical protein
MLRNLSHHFETLEAMKAAFLSRLSAFGSELLDRRPQPGAWSLSDIAQHLMLVDEEVLRQFTAAVGTDHRGRSPRDRVGWLMVNFVFRSGIRVEAPMRSVVPLSRKSLDEIRWRWDLARSDLSTYLSSLHPEDLDKILCRHPIAGAMTAEQTLELLTLHFNHHLKQVRRTERAIC